MIKKSLFIFCLFSSANLFGMEKSLLEQLPRVLQIQIVAELAPYFGNLRKTNKYFRSLLSLPTIIDIWKKNNTQEKITNESQNQFDNKIKEVWFDATEKKEMEKANDLITIVDPNVYDVNQSTALEYAAIERRDPEMVKWLLDNGSDPKKVTKSVIVAPIEKRLKIWIDAFSGEIKHAYQEILKLIKDYEEQKAVLDANEHLLYKLDGYTLRDYYQATGKYVSYDKI